MGFTRLESIKKIYKPGDRLELVHMEDSYAVPTGTQGTVDFIDDAGNVHMKWDNGSRLSFLPGVDTCKRLG